MEIRRIIFKFRAVNHKRKMSFVVVESLYSDGENKSYLKRSETLVSVCTKNVGCVVRASIFALYAGIIYHLLHRFKARQRFPQCETRE